MRRILIALSVIALLVVGATPASASPPSGEPIVVGGPFYPDDPEGEALIAELEAFGQRVGAEIVFVPVFDPFAAVSGPEPPDLLLTPQPAVLADLAPALVDLSSFVSPKTLVHDFGSYLIDQATVDGAVLGAPVKLDLKSLVWYEPAEFAAMGYAIPQTFAELVALSDQMVANGQTPWCNYLESGPATGWLATDWVEDLLLGAEGPVVYDQWTDHTVLFSDPRVELAFDRFQQLMDAPGYVFDRANLTSISFDANVLPLAFDDCLMHRQATFFAAFVQAYGFSLDEFATFKFPSVDPAFADFSVGGGVYLSALDDRTEVRQLTRFMLGSQFGRYALADVGGWVLPNDRFDLKRYGDDFTRDFAGIVHDSLAAGLYRFDASDMMPPEVGSGTFWAGMRDLLDGVKTVPEVLSDIDASWPN
jgi:alpha-glucoside transport system substrate-binding protein